MTEDWRSYVQDYKRNWDEYRGPLAKKLALTARNRAIASTFGRGCCGHLGEPGC
jgi:hypothetical protein